METPIHITRTERVDDIPLLLAQMDKMNIAGLLNKHFPMHGNWQGLSLGETVVAWLAYILSEGDHRLNSVQGWVAGILMTLTVCLKAGGLRELDFSDDRLAIVLYSLGQDAPWEAYEPDQVGVLLRVYDLPTRRVRIDSTTVKSYVTVTEDGLFQLGHSKELLSVVSVPTTLCMCRKYAKFRHVSSGMACSMWVIAKWRHSILAVTLQHTKIITCVRYRQYRCRRRHYKPCLNPCGRGSSH